MSNPTQPPLARSHNKAPNNTAPADFSPDNLRAAFANFITGVTIVCTRNEEGIPVGFTANSFTSVSLTPPLLLVCPSKNLSSFDAFQACKAFSISILSEGQEHISNTFAASTQDRFDQVDWQNDPLGNPIITGACTHFSCDTHQCIEAGDHNILIGHIKHFAATKQFGLGYGSLGYFNLNMERQNIQQRRDHMTQLGVLITHNEKLLMCKTPSGWNLPTTPHIKGHNTLSVLKDYLGKHGVSSDIDVFFSRFNDYNNNMIYTYYRGHINPKKPSPAVAKPYEWIALNHLHTLDFASETLEVMVKRFTFERENGLFNFYIGDHHEGDILRFTHS